MKAISIRQPWASLIAQGPQTLSLDLLNELNIDPNSGPKTIETRTWGTRYRGPLLIVSSLNPKIEGLLCGFALAKSKLVDCRPMTKEDEAAAKCELYPEAIAWVLANVKPIDNPFRVKGQLSTYEVLLPNEKLTF